MKHITTIFEIIAEADPMIHVIAGAYVIVCLIALTMILIGWYRNYC